MGECEVIWVFKKHYIIHYLHVMSRLKLFFFDTEILNEAKY